MAEEERDPWKALLMARQTRFQLILLGSLLAAIGLAVLLTDVATGGDTGGPPPLGASIEVTPGSRVIAVPTFAPIVTPTPLPAASPTPSSEADALARDSERLRELTLLQAALAEYFDRFDEYPDNDGQVQTMCAYRDLDKGCEVMEVLDEDQDGLFEDPLGERLVNGYWYASDGQSYTIFALKEGPASPGEPVCSDPPPHLKDKGSLFCTAGGPSP